MKITHTRTNPNIYHYCSVETFLAMIKNKTLRLSEITKANDSMEIMWLVQYIDDIFETVYNKDAPQYLTRKFPIAAFMESVARHKRDFFDEERGSYTFYATCFSGDGDLLSQWRGYANDGKGISVGFNESTLRSIGYPAVDDPFSTPLFSFQQVEYLESKQKALIGRIAQTLINQLKIIIKDTESDDIGVIKRNSMALFNSCFLELFKQSAFVKNGFFREEKEYRLAYWDNRHFDSIKLPSPEKVHIEDGLNFEQLGFLHRNGRIVSYIDLNFEKATKPFISEVVIGPKAKIDEQDISNFLIANKIDTTGITVRVSKGTYR